MAIQANELRRDGWLAALAAVALFATTFLPFLDLGNGADLTSFGAVENADEIGLMSEFGSSKASIIWYGIPLLTAVVVLLQMIGRWAVAGLVAMLLGVIAVVGSVLAYRTDLEPLPGWFLTVGLGALVIYLGARVDLFRKDVNYIQPW